MKLNKILFLEKFVLVTFPVALAVGCTTTANQSNKVSLLNETQVSQDFPIEPDSNLSVSQTESNGTIDEIPSILVSSTSPNHEKAQGETMQLNAQTHVMETNDQQLVSEESAATTENESLLKVKLAAPEHLTIAMPSQGIFYFEVNKYDISESDVEILEQHAEYLKHNTNMMLYVDGFSDNRGPANLNYRLSKKRAQQVGDVLIELGAPESRIKINGYGESFPLNSEMNHVENRRVELEYANIGASDELYAELK